MRAGATRSTLVVTAIVALASCTDEGGRAFARYYDPEGFFTTNLPAANAISVAPGEAPVPGTPTFLTGVESLPPQPSPQAPQGFGGALGATTAPSDLTVYRAFAISTDAFADLNEMALFFVTSNPTFDVLLDEPVRIDTTDARLLVVDALEGDQVISSLAVALTLGRNDTGYLVVALFPEGTWDDERADFLRILGSFRMSVPPGFSTIPVPAVAT
jgi:hypothetical protein